MTKNLKKMAALALACAALLAPPLYAHETGEEHTHDTEEATRPHVRGVWIHTWGNGMLTKEECDTLVEWCRASNINTIYPQVRRVGDSFYNKGVFEPRANNLEDPEFDPLQYLIDLCHDTSGGKQYIEVHAWLVTNRLWRSALGEPPAGHLFNEHPETIMQNADGETSASGTMFADPGHPMTIDWNTRVFRTVAENYDIDGIHHDYVRYPEYESDWGHNPVALERFRKQTGFEGTPGPDDAAWGAWRRQQMLDLTRRIYAEVKEVNPDCIVSASTLNWGLTVSPTTWYTSRPRTKAQQDWVQIMQEGWFDENCLMNYADHKTQPRRFPDYTDLALRTRLERHAIIGVGIYMNTVEDGFEQIRYALNEGADGVMLYAYQSLSEEDGVGREDYGKRLREEVFTDPVETPERPWISEPTYGLVLGQVTGADNAWADSVAVTLDGGDTTRTDGTGFFAFNRVMPGEHYILVEDANGNEHRQQVTVEEGKPVRVNFSLEK